MIHTVYNQSILKEISPECSLEGLMLKLKLQYFGHLMWRTESLEKTLMLGKIEGRRGRGRQAEMVGWHHRLDGHGFEQSPGGGDGQGGLVCCSPWGCKELDTAEQLNWTECVERRFQWWGNCLALVCCHCLVPHLACSKCVVNICWIVTVFILFFCLLVTPHVAGGILVPHPGIKPMPLALAARSPNHWAIREIPNSDCF